MSQSVLIGYLTDLFVETKVCIDNGTNSTSVQGQRLPVSTTAYLYGAGENFKYMCVCICICVHMYVCECVCVCMYL